MTANYRKQVAVFGAGITGLTAAHELIERGYLVEVYEVEPASPLDRLDPLSSAPCAVGGKARTQWSRVRRLMPDQVPIEFGPTQPIVDGLPVFYFDVNSHQLLPGSRHALKAAVEALSKLGPEEEVEVCGFVDVDEQKKRGIVRSDELARLRAEQVTKQLKGLVRCRLTPRASGVPPEWQSLRSQRSQTSAALTPRRTSDVLARRLQRGAMRSSADPSDRDGHDARRVTFRIVEDWIPGEHGFRFFPSFYRNVFDTLSRIPIAAEDFVYVETARTVLDNITATRMQRLGFEDAERTYEYPRRPPESLQDYFNFIRSSLRSLDFTLEDISRSQLKLFKFMTSCRERRTQEYEDISWWDFIEGDRFSPAYQRYLDKLGQLLVSIDAHGCDAHSYGLTSVQLVLDQQQQRSRIDGTLNGPTSLAWFDHWRRYLERQGVEFHHGKLVRFEVSTDGRHAWPVVQLYDGSGQAQGKPRVLVRDYCVVALSEVGLREVIDASPSLRSPDFDRFRAFSRRLGDPARAEPGGNLAHMSGIQYYFDTDIHFVEGHTIYPDSEWGLSSISQPQFWLERRGWWSGYRGILSVDICDWFSPSRATGKSAWQSSKEEIAQEVWRQIGITLGDKEGGHLPKPIFYHMDEAIELDGKNQRPVRNRLPYLVNRTGEYRLRPGTPDAYELSYGNIVMAGNYMQTYTRMTIMESANESARHAVNAILKASFYRGDWCKAWNPEDSEPEQLKGLVDLDRRLLEFGLPHFTDILEMQDLPAELLGGESTSELWTRILKTKVHRKRKGGTDHGNRRRGRP